MIFWGSIQRCEGGGQTVEAQANYSVRQKCRATFLLCHREGNRTKGICSRLGGLWMSANPVALGHQYESPDIRLASSGGVSSADGRHHDSFMIDW